MRAIVQYGRWLRWQLEQDRTHSQTSVHGFNKNHMPYVRIFFWIDYCCMDQNPEQTTFFVHSLPLYVSACQYMVSYTTPDYSERAWCRVEQTMAFAYMRFGREPFVIDKSFVHQQQEVRIVKAPLRNPLEGKLTVASDLSSIEELLHVADDTNSFTFCNEFYEETCHSCGPAHSTTDCVFNTMCGVAQVVTCWCFGLSLCDFFCVNAKYRKRVSAAMRDEYSLKMRSLTSVSSEPQLTTTELQ